MKPVYERRPLLLRFFFFFFFFIISSYYEIVIGEWGGGRGLGGRGGARKREESRPKRASTRSRPGVEIIIFRYGIMRAPGGESRLVGGEEERVIVVDG